MRTHQDNLPSYNQDKQDRKRLGDKNFFLIHAPTAIIKPSPAHKQRKAQFPVDKKNICRPIDSKPRQGYTFNQPAMVPAITGGEKMDTAQLEQRTRDLLDRKIQAGELGELHKHYTIRGVYKYSFNNQLMIWLQGGTLVRGFHDWKKAGRYVKKGEHAHIYIYAPSVRKYEKKNDAGEVDIESRVVGFIPVKVFDIGQTDGKPLQYEANSADTISLKFDDIKYNMVNAFDLKIDTGITGEARGWYSKTFREIKISEMSNNTDKVKTLFHEIAHHILHGEDSEHLASSSAKEVEAELTSNLVCESLGIKCAQSEQYIAHWNEHKPKVRVLKVFSAVSKILKAVEPVKAGA